MTNKTPSGAEKRHESTEPESSKTVKMFFFLLSFFFITGNLYCTRGHDTESIVNGSISVQRDNYGKFTYVCGKQQLQSWL